LNGSYINSLTIWKKFGSRIQKLSISQIILNYGGIKSVTRDLRGIGPQNKLKARKTLEVLSKRPSMNFSIPKFKKLWAKIKNSSPWELMNWVKKCKLPAIKAIQYNGYLCLELKYLWQALHLSFNSVQNCCINLDLLEEIPDKLITKWMPFSEEEFRSSIAKCNNSLTPRLYKLSWKHLKIIVNNTSCFKNFINIANVCINLGYWPLHFKTLLPIIIPKSNKASYNSPKAFRPIVLLNMLGKLIEKVIGKRLQFQLIFMNFIHLYQLGKLKQ